MKHLSRERRSPHPAYTLGELYDIYCEFVDKGSGPRLAGDNGEQVLLEARETPITKDCYESFAEHYLTMSCGAIREKVALWEDFIIRGNAGNALSIKDRGR